MAAEEFNPNLDHLAQIERLRSKADAQIRIQYAADPQLHAFAEEQGELFAHIVCGRFFVDPRVDPAGPMLRSAFTKMAFMFTDPENYADTPTNQGMMEILDEFWQGATPEDVRNYRTLLEDVAFYMDRLAASAFFVEQKLREQGDLDDLTADGRLAVVKAWLELAVRPETDEPER